MSLEVFSQMNKNGETGTAKASDFVIAGLPGDFKKLSRWIMDGYEASLPRKYDFRVLANRLEKETDTKYFVRLKRRDCQILVQALDQKRLLGTPSPAASRLLGELVRCF